MKTAFFHTKVFLVIILFFSGSYSTVAQDMADIAFYRSQELRVKLGLNLEQTQKMEASLLRFGEAYKKLLAEGYDENQTFQEKYDNLKKEREKDLKTFLDDRQLEVFNVIQEQRMQSIRDFYATAREQMVQNEEFTRELGAYQHNVMLPDLLRFRSKLDLQINREDSLLLIDNAKVFNEILDDLLQDENLEAYASTSNITKSLKKYSRKDPETKKTFKNIQKLQKKYKEPIDKITKEMDPLEALWQKEISNIITRHLPAEEHDAYKNILNLMGVFGVSHKIDPMVFLLFDPSSEDSYFQLKQKLYRIFFKDMI